MNHFPTTLPPLSSLWIFCRGRLHDPRQGEFGGYAHADKGVCVCVCAKAWVGLAELLASGMAFPPPVVRSCASRSYGSSARSRLRTWPSAFRVCGPQLASPPDGSAPPCTPPNPSSSDAARHARPKPARLPRPRHAQLRLERVLALAHAVRHSQGLRPAAHLSARRQRAALHSPLNPSSSAAARHAQGRSALFFILKCNNKKIERLHHSCASFCLMRFRT